MGRNVIGRVPGHKLVVESNNERGEEHAATGRCICGRWEESASSQKVVRQEYRHHLVRARNELTTLMVKLAR